MNIFDEKKAIYEQMRLLIEERREITKEYYALKQEINCLKRQTTSNLINSVGANKKNWSTDIENQKYMLSKRSKNSGTVMYHDVALKTASFLKEAKQPISTKHIFKFLVQEYYPNLSYNNFVSNLLPKIHDDPNINVERAYRGYWQYRLK
ncbi:hypothetical protein FG877_02760 [Enterococcus casseliflavus]|nr:hypothetical protein [Enterococcus casseliflavus]